MSNLFAKLKLLPIRTWILFAIMAVGIFLRTYNFHDWLLFSPDQARDASLISEAMKVGARPILLGAQAGNTQFHLGPIYYQMQHLSAMIFGNHPDKLAYPDLLFSILTIPLLFFLLKKYFSENISLFLTALFSMSYFSIFAARFAVNSNSLSFFVLFFFYGLLEMMDKKNKNNHVWPMAVGIGLGIGVQLHALSFVFMPIIALVILAYLIVAKNLTWKNFVLVVLFFLLMNIGQITYEINTGGSNFRHFLSGADSQSGALGSDDNLGENIFLSTLCQARSNLSQISSSNYTKYCSDETNFKRALVDSEKTGSMSLLMRAMMATFFAIGGYWLCLVALFGKKVNRERKKFLALLLLFNVVFLALVSTIVFQAEVHYFNAIFFGSFIFLGLYLEKINELKMEAKIKKMVVIIVLGSLLLLNFYYLGSAAFKYLNGKASDGETSVLGEIVPVANYVVENSRRSGMIYLDGDKSSLHRFFAPLAYLGSGSGIEINKWHENYEDNGNSNYVLFYLSAVGDAKKNKDENMIDGRSVVTHEKFGNLTVYVLNNGLSQ